MTWHYLEGLEGRLEAWKGALESKLLRINFKKTKMISSENAGKITIEIKFRCAFCRKLLPHSNGLVI